MSRNGNFICFTLVWLLRVSCTARTSNKSILKEINPEYSLEGLKLKLKFQYFGHLHQYWCKELIHWKRPWYWERLRAAGEGDNRGWDGWMASLTQWTWVWASSRRWWRTGKPGVLHTVHRVSKNQTWLSDWTTKTNLHSSYIIRVTIYSLDILLSQFSTSTLTHVWF